MTETAPRAKIWKRVLAPVLDFITIFWVGGFAIGSIAGMRTEEGFSLTGAPALVLFALIILYFFVGRRYAGGTLWDRVFRIARPQPAD